MYTSIVVVGLASTVVVAGAWSRTQARTPAVLTPGASDITTSHLRNSASTYRYLMRRPTGDSTEREVSAGRTEQVLTRHNGKPALLLIGTSMHNGVVSWDSALVMQGGLAPVWEKARNTERTAHWEYAGKDVRVTLGRPDSATTTRQHTYDVPVFSFQELDVVVRSLPLREGYEAIVPLYSEGGDALEMDSVRVVSKTGDVWTVKFADADIVTTYGVDAKTRDIVSQEIFQRKSGARIRKVMNP